MNRDLSSRFAHFHATTEPYLTGHGGAEVRATVARRRRRAATTAALTVVLVIVLGAVAIAAEFRGGTDRLVPAAPPMPTPSPLGNSSLDLRRIDPKMCGGQVVQFKNHSASLWRSPGAGSQPNDYTFSLDDGLTRYGDLNGDGAPDRLVVLSCVGEGGGAAQQWLMYVSQAPHPIAWLVFPAPCDDGSIIAAEGNSGSVIKTYYRSGGKHTGWAYDRRTHKLTAVSR